MFSESSMCFNYRLDTKFVFREMFALEEILE